MNSVKGDLGDDNEGNNLRMSRNVCNFSTTASGCSLISSATLGRKVKLL